MHDLHLSRTVKQPNSCSKPDGREYFQIRKIVAYRGKMKNPPLSVIAVIIALEPIAGQVQAFA